MVIPILVFLFFTIYNRFYTLVILRTKLTTSYLIILVKPLSSTTKNILIYVGSFNGILGRLRYGSINGSSLILYTGVFLDLVIRIVEMNDSGVYPLLSPQVIVFLLICLPLT